MEEFLKQLREHLKGLPESERNEIIRDHEEMIRDAMASGKSETDAVLAFGDPRTLAKSLTATSLVQSSSVNASRENVWTEFRGVGRAVFAVAALAPFNLIFVLGPFLAVVGCLTAGWAVVGAGVAASVAAFFAIMSVSFTPLTIFWAPVAGGFLALSGFFFSLAGCMFMAFLTRGFAKLALQYLQWNLSFIVPETASNTNQTKAGQT